MQMEWDGEGAGRRGWWTEMVENEWVGKIVFTPSVGWGEVQKWVRDGG